MKVHPIQVSGKLDSIFDTLHEQIRSNGDKQLIIETAVKAKIKPCCNKTLNNTLSTHVIPHPYGYLLEQIMQTGIGILRLK
ncbi:MAG: hypothetical protein ACTS8H_03605 [Arsenophonus sp. NC-PE1-MAG3]